MRPTGTTFGAAVAATVPTGVEAGSATADVSLARSCLPTGASPTAEICRRCEALRVAPLAVDRVLPASVRDGAHVLPQAVGARPCSARAKTRMSPHSRSPAALPSPTGRRLRQSRGSRRCSWFGDARDGVAVVPREPIGGVRGDGLLVAEQLSKVVEGVLSA